MRVAVKVAPCLSALMWHHAKKTERSDIQLQLSLHANTCPKILVVSTLQILKTSCDGCFYKAKQKLFVIICRHYVCQFKLPYMFLLIYQNYLCWHFSYTTKIGSVIQNAKSMILGVLQTGIHNWQFIYFQKSTL